MTSKNANKPSSDSLDFEELPQPLETLSVSSESTDEQPEPLDIPEKIRQLGKIRALKLPQMEQLHVWLDAKRLARQSCRVIGESRTGKTVSCKAYCVQHRVTQIPGYPPTVPVVYWLCPEKVSVSGFFLGLLNHFQYQATRGRIPELRDRLYNVLRSCDVEMLILDEAQRLTEPALAEVRDISDELGIAVVLVGTERLNAVLQWDEQVKYRFLSGYRIARLEASQFRDTTAFLEKHVLQLPKPSKLTSAKAQDLLLQATKGYIGVLDQVLRTAAMQALSQGRTHIDYGLLHQTVKECSF